MKKSLAALLLVTGFYACSSDHKSDGTSDTTIQTKTGMVIDSLTYQYDSVKVYSKNRVSKNKQVTDTAKAVIVYPKFADEAANKFIMDRVIGLTGKQDIYRSYKDVASGFIKDFDTYQAANLNSTESWFQQINLKVVTNLPNYVSVLQTYVEYKGGAHANSLYTYFNYNPKNYQTITLDSLIKPEGMPKLRSVAENIFRKNEQLAPNANLSDSYFFNEGVFSLPQTFTVTKDGIKFIYNPAEIKAFAAGTTELTVPFDNIKDIMTTSSILTNFN
jgi:hypothetical protein